MEGLRTALCSVRVPSLVQMRSGDYWRSLLTNKGVGTGGGSEASHKNGGAFFGTFEVTYLVFFVDYFNGLRVDTCFGIEKTLPKLKGYIFFLLFFRLFIFKSCFYFFMISSVLEDLGVQYPSDHVRYRYLYPYLWYLS
jgi:hypothetical protein